MSLLLTGAGSSSPGISSPVGLAGCSLWARPGQDTVLTGGGQTFVAGDKCDARIADGSATDLEILDTDWTISGWVNFASVAAGTGGVITKGGTAAGDAGYCVYRDGTSLKAALSNGSSQVVATIGTVAASTWYFFAAVFDRSANLTGYLNASAGTPADISGISASINSDDAFLIGSNGTNYLGGNIACVAIHAKALSSAEITTLYNNRNVLPYASWSAGLKTNLVSLWPLDEPLVGDPTYVTGASATVRDQHGSNHLTFTNTELLSNTGFETAGAGGADVFDSWSEFPGDGTIEDETTIVQAGSHSAKLTRGTNAISIRQFTTTTGTVYVQVLYAKASSGTPNIYVGEAGSLSQKGITSDWAECRHVFTSSSGGLSALGIATNGAVVYFDSVSLKVPKLTACNGPSTAIASDSVGTLHGTLTGFSQSGEIVNWIPRGDDYALYFDGTDDNLVCGNAGNVTHVAFDVKSAVANQELFTLANSTATAVTVVAGTLTFGASLTASNITVDGASKTAAQAGALINDGSWHTVEFDLTSIAASSLKLATDSSAYGNIYLDNFTVSLSGSATHTYTFSDGAQANPIDGDPVLGLLSSEGSLLKFDQSTLSARPEYEFATTGLNNQPSIKFDGVNSFLRLAQNFAPTDTAGTLFLVWLTDDDVTTEQVLFGTADEASATKFWRLGIASGGLKYNQNDAGTADTLTGGTIATTTAYLVMLSSDGSTISGSINNTAVASWTAASGANNGDWLGDTSDRDSLCLGASNANATAALFAKGYLGEVFYFNRILNASEIRRVNRYITKLWGITL